MTNAGYTITPDGRWRVWGNDGKTVAAGQAPTREEAHRVVAKILERQEK